MSGTVTVDDGGARLRFEGDDQSQGPDVLVYLTADPEPDTTAAVAAGRTVPIDGGESTKTGTFSQSLGPDFADADLASYRGVAIRRDALSVPFGWATLESVD